MLTLFRQTTLIGFIALGYIKTLVCSSMSSISPVKPSVSV